MTIAGKGCAAKVFEDDPNEDAGKAPCNVAAHEGGTDTG